MKKDIDFPIIEGIQVVIAKETEDDWYAYLINKNTYSIENVLITTKGYGSFPEAQKTSTLRHSIKKLDKKVKLLTQRYQILNIPLYIDSVNTIF
jgi:hypothetical protein